MTTTVETKNDYPSLECPICGRMTKPRSLNQNGSATYSCPPDHEKHGQRYTWRIAVTGELVEKW